MKEYISYVHSFPTNEIEDMLFQGDYSPELCVFDIIEPIGEYRFIGDELMKVDKENFPPNAIIFKEKI